MRALATRLAILLLVLTGVSHALPDTLASFPEVSGTIKSIEKGELCTAVRIALTNPEDRKVARKIHTALRLKTYYPFKSFSKHSRDEALLLFTGKELDPFKVGDRIVVRGYSIIADLEASRRGWPRCTKIEKQ